VSDVLARLAKLIPYIVAMASRGEQSMRSGIRDSAEQFQS
jgi:hypothetical protein